MKVLPDSMLRKMSAADRKAIGQMSAEEAAEKFVKRSEREQHVIFLNWLNQQEWCREHGYVFHADTTRKTTFNVGYPDFDVKYMGRCLLIEMKVPGGRLSDDQKACHERLILAGCYVHVCISASEAIVVTRKWQQSIMGHVTKLTHKLHRTE